MVTILHRAVVTVGFLKPRSFGRSDPCRQPRMLQSAALFLVSADTGEIHTVTLPKPMGIILEEVDESDPTAGVMVKELDPAGAAAAASKVGDVDLCLRDVILEVNGASCADEEFDDVMERIVTSPGSEVTLTLGRPAKAVAVRCPNGICVAANPGEYLGEIAQLAGARIQYSCMSGSCATCEQSMLTDDGDQRYVRPCVARVPKGPKAVVLVPTDRYA